jgi:CRP-like cAMP-binding protein
MIEQQSTERMQHGVGGTASLVENPLSPEMVSRLHSVPILASLDDTAMHCLDGVTARSLQAGDLLMRQGEVARKFWMLLGGSLRLSQTASDGHEMTVHVLEQGSAFGEYGR